MSKTTLIDCCIKKYAYREISEIYKEIGASPQGLFPEQVDGMRRRYGENSFAKRKKDTMLRCLRRAFINPFHIILFVLGMISWQLMLCLPLILPETPPLLSSFSP